MPNPVTIELRGVEFVNKGAELMLHAIQAAVAGFNRPVRLVMETSPRATKKQIRAAGLLPKSRFGLFDDVKESEVDMILDASGFAYGDTWGAKKANRRLGAHIRRWKQAGKTVILLPQAFGPFRVPELRKEMAVIFKEADRVYVRDSVSMRHVQGIHSGPNILQTPDFTNLVAPIAPKSAADFAERVAVIPNIKMIEAVPKGGPGYIDTMAGILAAIRKEGREPFLLLHEADKDVEVAKLINATQTVPLQVVAETHPLRIKGIIGASYAVVTSRFHGLVSALSQGVPCIATSWSHKYEELLAEYGYPQGLIGKDTDVAGRVAQMLDPATQTIERAHLNEKALEYKETSKRLWTEIETLLPTGQ
jgi:colanic acid/amylovoran biosynthesis protein